MEWIKVTIETTNEATDAVSEMLVTSGASGVDIHDPREFRNQLKISNPSEWADEKFLESLGEVVKVSAYFDRQEFINSKKDVLIREKLEFISGFLDAGSLIMTVSTVKDEDWTNNWKKYFKPMRISEKVVVKPTWENYEVKDNEIVINIDPGMAFGTGQHETTRMCAALLEKYVRDGDIVLDIGCGTGILSIIASKLGASEITAVDIDELAVKTAKDNCILNNSGNVDVFKGELENVSPSKYNIIVANIIADVIIGISDQLRLYSDRDSIIITSGIIKDRMDEVLKVYSEKGYDIIEKIHDGEWVAMVLKCRDFS